MLRQDLDLERKLFHPSELRITYFHDEKSHDYQNTIRWLDKFVMEKRIGDIPLILTLQDIEDGSFLVYDGNKRIRHATQYSYSLSGLIISDAQDFAKIVAKDELCWFGIEDYVLLIQVMRMYAQFPHFNVDMPQEYKEVIQPLLESQRRRHYEQMMKEQMQLFPYDDDD